jgi:hypothetical protein
MPAQFLYPNVGALFLAGKIQTALATAKLKLFKAPMTLTPATTQADLAANESGFSGYAAKTVTAFQAPYLASAGGAAISSGYQQWDFTPPAPPAVPVTENVYGFWLEDSTGALVAAGSFANPISMGAIGDSVPLSVTLTFGASA